MATRQNRLAIKWGMALMHLRFNPLTRKRQKSSVCVKRTEPARARKLADTHASLQTMLVYEWLSLQKKRLYIITHH